jgi:hypothetical protein
VRPEIDGNSTRFLFP